MNNLTDREIRALGTLLDFVRKDYSDGLPAACVRLLETTHLRLLAPLADKDGHGEEDGPWADGYAERSGIPHCSHGLPIYMPSTCPSCHAQLVTASRYEQLATKLGWYRSALYAANGFLEQLGAKPVKLEYNGWPHNTKECPECKGFSRLDGMVSCPTCDNSGAVSSPATQEGQPK